MAVVKSGNQSYFISGQTAQDYNAYKNEQAGGGSFLNTVEAAGLFNSIAHVLDAPTVSFDEAKKLLGRDTKDSPNDDKIESGFNLGSLAGG